MVRRADTNGVTPCFYGAPCRLQDLIKPALEPGHQGLLDLQYTASGALVQEESRVWQFGLKLMRADSVGKTGAAAVLCLLGWAVPGVLRWLRLNVGKEKAPAPSKLPLLLLLPAPTPPAPTTRRRPNAHAHAQACTACARRARTWPAWPSLTAPPTASWATSPRTPPRPCPTRAPAGCSTQRCVRVGGGVQPKWGAFGGVFNPNGVRLGVQPKGARRLARRLVRLRAGGRQPAGVWRARAQPHVRTAARGGPWPPPTHHAHSALHAVCSQECIVVRCSCVQPDPRMGTRLVDDEMLSL